MDNILYVYLNSGDYVCLGNSPTAIDDLKKKAEAFFKENRNLWNGAHRFEFIIPHSLNSIYYRKGVINQCQIIILGDGWEQDPICQQEKDFAEKNGIAVWYEKNIEPGTKLKSAVQIVTEADLIPSGKPEFVYSRETRLGYAIDGIRLAKEQTFLLYNQTDAEFSASSKEASELYDKCYETLKIMELDLKNQLKREVNK